jgi:hypothetical protein
MRCQRSLRGRTTRAGAERPGSASGGTRRAEHETVSRRGLTRVERALCRAGLVVGLGLYFCLGGSEVRAQTNAAARRPANRYLLIVENSRSIQRRLEGMVQSVRELLDSGMGGQLQRGDTLGLWTFNDEVYAGRFALEQWSPEAQSAITGRVLDFLKTQKYEKPARLEKVLPALERVLRDSEFLTLILVTDGAEDLEGTPFDKQVNDVFEQWRARQEQKHMPFVTVLRAEKGKFTAGAANPTPWRVELRSE